MTAGMLRADWAYIGQPGRSEDSQISRTSNWQVVPEYVSRYVTGLPDPHLDPDAPGAPPWVTFGPMFSTREQKFLVAVSILDRSLGTASGGRRIWPQRVFLISYDEMAAARASYRGIWTALENIDLPIPGDQPIGIGVPAQPTDALVESIDAIGQDHIATLAALILEGRLALAGLAAATREERLDILDAIMSLLPYSCRALVPVATGVDNFNDHRTDIVFAEDPQADQVIVQMLRGHFPRPKTPFADEYLRLLSEKIQTSGLHAVVEHLWSATKAHQGGQWELVKPTLEELDFNNAFKRALRTRTAVKSTILGFLGRADSVVRSSWLSSEMTADMRQFAVDMLLGAPDSQTVPALARHWETVRDDLLGAANKGLDDGDVTLATRCLQVANASPAPDASDMLLAGLLSSEWVTAGCERKRRAALVRLLGESEPWSLGGLPRVLDRARRDHPAWQSSIFRDLLTHEADKDVERLDAWAKWLCRNGRADDVGDGPDWVAAIGLVMFGDDHVSEDRPYPKIVDPVWAALLVRLAARPTRLAYALPMMREDLVEIGAAAFAGAPARQETGRLLNALDQVDPWPADVDPVEIAHIDAVRMLLGGSPSGFPWNLGSQATSRYLSGLRTLFAADAVHEARSWLAAEFLRFAVPARGAARLPDGAVQLLNDWSADGELRLEVAGYIAVLPDAARPIEPGLGSQYWDCVARQPGLEGYTAVPHLMAAAREAVAAPSVHLARKPQADQAGVVGVTGTKLATACYRAHKAGLPADAVLKALREAGAANLDPRWLDRVLRELQHVLLHDVSGGRNSETVYFDYCRHIAHGAFGPEYAATFASYRTYLNDGESMRRAQLSRMLAAEVNRGPGGTEPAIDRRRTLAATIGAPLAWLWRRVRRRSPDNMPARDAGEADANES